MKISALDENGKPTDWWFMYKVPELHAGSNNDKATGYEYVYYDATIDKASDRKITRSPNVINEGKGALNLTLNSVFSNPGNTTGWVLYNDELPDSVQGNDNGNLGHTKGVIAFDTASQSAYWLLHSWPKFADPGAKSDPTPKYGQTYLCLSLDIDSARKIAAQMAGYQEPQTYDCRKVNLSANDPLALLMQPLNPNAPGGSNVLDLKTSGGTPFKVIAKNREWNDDFWNDLVGPTLKEDMDVDTWIRGPIPPVADSDGIHKTFDIKFINLGPLGAHWAWPETHDHAKWGITKQSNWVCVGDINRMISQRKRGGGAIALQNETLWRGLSKTDLVLAPPGHSRTDTHTFIKKSHTRESEAPPRAQATVREPPPSGTKKAPSKKASAKKVSTKKVPTKKGSAKKGSGKKGSAKKR